MDNFSWNGETPYRKRLISERYFSSQLECAMCKFWCGFGSKAIWRQTVHWSLAGVAVYYMLTCRWLCGVFDADKKDVAYYLDESPKELCKWNSSVLCSWNQAADKREWFATLGIGFIQVPTHLFRQIYIILSFLK